METEEPIESDRTIAIGIIVFYVCSILFYWAVVLPQDKVSCINAWKEYNNPNYNTYYGRMGGQPLFCRESGEQNIYWVGFKTIIAPVFDGLYILGWINTIYV